MSDTQQKDLFRQIINNALSPDIWDALGAASTSGEEFFKQMGAYAAKSAAGALQPADALALRPLFERLALGLERLSAGVNIPLPNASDASKKVARYAARVALEARFRASQLGFLADAIQAGDDVNVNRLTAVVSSGFRQLGAAFALMQTLWTLASDDGSVAGYPQVEQNLRDATGKALSFYVGMKTGAGGALLGGVAVAGIAAAVGAAAPVLIIAGAVAGGVAGAYIGGKAAEEFWDRAYENYKTVYLPGIVDDSAELISYVSDGLETIFTRIGWYEGPWLKNLALDSESKALLTTPC